MSFILSIFSASINYSFNQNASIGFGPRVIVGDWKDDPIVMMQLEFTLGGGKF